MMLVTWAVHQAGSAVSRLDHRRLMLCHQGSRHQAHTWLAGTRRWAATAGCSPREAASTAVLSKHSTKANRLVQVHTPTAHMASQVPTVPMTAQLTHSRSSQPVWDSSASTTATTAATARLAPSRHSKTKDRGDENKNDRSGGLNAFWKRG